MYRVRTICRYLDWKLQAKVLTKDWTWQFLCIFLGPESLRCAAGELKQWEQFLPTSLAKINKIIGFIICNTGDYKGKWIYIFIDWQSQKLIHIFLESYYLKKIKYHIFYVILFQNIYPVEILTQFKRKQKKGTCTFKVRKNCLIR